jgi:hypothetical protein
VLPIALRAVAREMGLGGKHWDEALDPRLKPGAAIVLHREAEGGVVAADRLEA